MDTDMSVLYVELLLICMFVLLLNGIAYQYLCNPCIPCLYTELCNIAVTRSAYL